MQSFHRCAHERLIPFGHEKTKRLGLPYGKYGYLGLLDLPYGKYGYLGLLDLPSVSNENLLLGAIPDLKVGALRPSLRNADFRTQKFSP